MSNNKSIKFYKNPSRNIPEVYKPYVPQYQELGIEPMEYRSALPNEHVVPIKQAIGSTVNPRLPHSVMRQPYAETTQPIIGQGRSTMPNVGNNIEQVWSGVDGEIIDDLTMNADQPMIDNNDFVSSNVLEAQNASSVKQDYVSQQELQHAINEDELANIIKDVEVEQYLLIVAGAPICSGALEVIETQVRSLVFGDHPSCNGNPVSLDDIVVIKRIGIKIGIFLT